MMTPSNVGGRIPHPRRGIHQPTSSTPVRVPGSVRRTATTTAVRPDGLDGPLYLFGRARDLLTISPAASRIIDVASYHAEVDFCGDRTIKALETTPPRHADQLIGIGAASGFRTVLEQTLPLDRESRRLIYLLLDDLPVATLVSGYALGWAGAVPRHSPARMLTNTDICAGWRDGGTITEGIKNEGRPPVVIGPPAPSLLSDDDLAWHTLEPMPEHSVRRHRRLDVIPRGDQLGIDLLFRDTHMSPLGTETVIHEYTVKGSIDRSNLTVTTIEASPRVLPWLECPLAAASAARLLGTAVGNLRRLIRADFTGTGTCTHLNDTLRSMEDVVALRRILDAARAPSGLNRD